VVAVIPGGGRALSIVHPPSPVLRMRYRHGVLVTPQGYPDWVLYARAVVEVPPPATGLSLDEARVTRVLAANEAMTGDPPWAFTRDDFVAKTPPGWVWAHLPDGHTLALVPAELHGSFRHAGGVRALPADRRGLRVDERSAPVGVDSDQWLGEEVMVALEQVLGHRLPPSYRAFLAATNGGFPTAPGVLPGLGFVVDQRLFGLARADRHQELPYAAAWLRDRLTADWLAVGYVQGGVLAVKVRGPDTDSVWYLDDDDPRDDDSFNPERICAELLHRCADSMDAFWSALRTPAGALLDLVDVTGAREVRPPLCGALLPAGARAPWQTGLDRTTTRDPLVAMLEATS
jgi:hypothetical protein